MKWITAAFVLLLFAVPAHADWTVIRQITQGSTNSDSFTTSAFDGAGGNTIFYFLAGYDSGPETATITDSHSNIITCLSDLIDASGRLSRLCYSLNATTSASMTVAVTDGGALPVYPCVSVLVVSNTAGAVAALDKQDTGTSSGSSVNALAVGAVVPDTNGEFIVSGLAMGDAIGGLVSVDAPFTISGDNVGQEDLSAGNHFGCALAYYEQATAASVNPNFTWAGAAVPVNAITASFRDNSAPPCSGSSPNLTATTWDDVTVCHTLAANSGDTITVNTGSYTVTTNTVITKDVRIVCAVALACDLTDNTASASDLINITESTLGNTKLEGFDFIQGSAAHTNPNGVIVTTYATNGKPILIKGNRYTASNYTADFIIAGSPYRGVIWDNTMTDVAGLGGGSCNNQAAFARIKNIGLTAVWTEVPYYGMDDTNGDKNLYIEDNELDNVHQGIDCDANCRVVLRHNTFTNSGTLNHGVDTGDVSGRYMVIGPSNTFEWDTTDRCGASTPAGVISFIFLRGAPALIHDNIIPDVSSMAWGDKLEVNFADEKLRRSGAGTYLCWNQGYPSRQQVGWGYSAACPGGCTQAGTTGEYQILEPVYLWGNTGAGNYASPNVYDYQPDECGNGLSSATYIQVNREYYLNTAKPGYTAYTYPHPLQGEAVAGQINGTLRLRH